VKKCKKCDYEKPVDKFPRGSCADGHSSWCKACHGEASTRWKRENPGKVRAARTLRAAMNRGDDERSRLRSLEVRVEALERQLAGQS
jgi:hypothetical protein